MRRAGHPENVSVAAAYANARRHGDGEKHIAKAKRPGLHAGHPFNSAKAPDNRKHPAPAANIPMQAGSINNG